MTAAGPAGPGSRSSRELFDRPIFIVSSPRSGSTMLFETLANAPGLFSIAGESHKLIETIPAFSPMTRGWESNVLTSGDALAEAAEKLAGNFYGALRDREGRPAQGRVRMLEKTPKNALRVAFLNAIWPDARFVYLYRDPRQTLASMMEAWASGRFRTYPTLPGWSGPPWSLLLVPGWRELKGLPIPAIAAHQWAITTDLLVSELERLPPERVHAIVYDDVVARPQQTAQTLAAALELAWDRQLGDVLPLSRYTLSRPHKDKWRAIEEHIKPVLSIVEAADKRARAFLASRDVAQS